jgi:hypothetical protein
LPIWNNKGVIIMSVDCRLFIGLTLEFAKDLRSEDFRKCEEFCNKHPELSEYRFDESNIKHKIILVGDGMNGDFLRLIYVDEFFPDGCLSPANDFVELDTPKSAFNPEIVKKMSEIYEEYTGKPCRISDFKYALWSQWY